MGTKGQDPSRFPLLNSLSLVSGIRTVGYLADAGRSGAPPACLWKAHIPEYSHSRSRTIQYDPIGQFVASPGVDTKEKGF